jgi:hypothetical protein
VLYRLGPTLSVEARAAAERIGIHDSCLRVTDAQDAVLLCRSDALPDHDSALEALFTWLRVQRLDDGLRGKGSASCTAAVSTARRC